VKCVSFSVKVCIYMSDIRKFGQLQVVVLLVNSESKRLPCSFSLCEFHTFAGGEFVLFSPPELDVIIKVM